MGIAPDKVNQVFDRFVKLNTFSKGTGLKLSICRSIIKHLGGTIGVITLKAIEKAPQKEIQNITIAKDKLIILIAEDNESNYKLFESILKYDYHLIHAWDGQEAVNMFKEYGPQIVLIDIMQKRIILL